MNKESFFRAESIEQRDTSYGVTREIKPLVGKRIFLPVCLFLVFVLMLVTFTSYSKKESITGVLESSKGVSRVYPRSLGVIKGVFVSVGDKVVAGQKLMTIDVSHYSGLDIETLKQKKLSLSKRREEIKSQIEKEFKKKTLTKVSFDQQMINQNTAIKSYEIGLESEKERVIISTRQLTSADTLAKKNHISANEHDNFRLELLNSKNNVREIKDQIASTNSRLVSLKNEQELVLESSDIRLSELRNELAQINDEEDTLNARSYYDISSPIDGVVIGVQGYLGVNVTEQVSIVNILPDGAELLARLYIPTTSIGFIENDMDVLISYKAFPKRNYGVFKGRLIEVGKSLYKSQELSTSLNLESGHYYSGLAKLPNQYINVNDRHVMLLPDMEFDAVVLLDKKPIIYWALSPIYELVYNL